MCTHTQRNLCLFLIILALLMATGHGQATLDTTCIYEVDYTKADEAVKRFAEVIERLEVGSSEPCADDNFVRLQKKLKECLDGRVTDQTDCQDAISRLNTEWSDKLEQAKSQWQSQKTILITERDNAIQAATKWKNDYDQSQIHVARLQNQAIQKDLTIAEQQQTISKLKQKLDQCGSSTPRPDPPIPTPGQNCQQYVEKYTVLFREKEDLEQQIISVNGLYQQCQNDLGSAKTLIKELSEKKCPTCQICEKCPTCPTCQKCPTCPTCPTCPKCPKCPACPKPEEIIKKTTTEFVAKANSTISDLRTLSKHKNLTANMQKSLQTSLTQAQQTLTASSTAQDSISALKLIVLNLLTQQQNLLTAYRQTDSIARQSNEYQFQCKSKLDQCQKKLRPFVRR